jgi:hypothetical protein
MNKIFNMAMLLFFFAGLTLAVEPDKTVETGETLQLSATASDKDCHFKTGKCPHLDTDDAFTYSWSATAGSFPSGNTGQSVTWKAPDSPCDVTVNVTASNSGSTKAIDSGASDSIWVKVIGSFSIISQTTVMTPANRTRTTLGLGESTKVYTDPETNVTWSVTGNGGEVSPKTGTYTYFSAKLSPGSATVHATTGSIDKTISYTIIAPSSESYTLISDNSMGTKGPPNNQIGSSSTFRITVLPISVSFYAVSFQEDIPSHSWTWPDGTNESIPAYTVPWSVSPDNTAPDNYSSPLLPIGRIFNGSNYVNFSVNLDHDQDYRNQNLEWVSYTHVTAPTEYRGSDQASRQVISGTAGGWMGPWQ